MLSLNTTVTLGDVIILCIMVQTITILGWWIITNIVAVIDAKHATNAELAAELDAKTRELEWHKLQDATRQAELDW